MKQSIFIIAALLTACGLLNSCMGGGKSMMSGGEVTGSKAASFTEPTPYGMVEVKRGYLKVGIEKTTLCGELLHLKKIFL